MAALPRAGEAGGGTDAPDQPRCRKGPPDPVLREGPALAEITAKRIDAYRKHGLTVGGSHGRPLGPSTVARDMTKRHTYGTMAVQIYDLPKVQLYMGHEHVGTTMRYVHSRAKTEDAAKGSAFIAAQLETVSPLCPEPAHSDTTESNSEH
jgi:hypothetical protein